MLIQNQYVRHVVDGETLIKWQVVSSHIQKTASCPVYRTLLYYFTCLFLEALFWSLFLWFSNLFAIKNL